MFDFSNTLFKTSLSSLLFKTLTQNFKYYILKITINRMLTYAIFAKNSFSVCEPAVY